MAITVSLNGVNQSVPEVGDANWAAALTQYLVALATAFPQTAGSVGFTALTSASANPATAGVLRLAKTDGISWRNQGNTANDNLAPNSNDDLQWFNGATSAITQITGQPHLQASVTVTQTGIANTGTIVVFNSVAVDTDSAYNAGTGRYTVPVGKGGPYLITANVVVLQNTSAGIAEGNVYINGSLNAEFGAANLAATNFYCFSGATVLRLNAGDVVDFRIKTSAGTLSTQTSNFSTLAIKRLV